MLSSAAKALQQNKGLLIKKVMEKRTGLKEDFFVFALFIYLFIYLLIYLGEKALISSIS